MLRMQRPAVDGREALDCYNGSPGVPLCGECWLAGTTTCSACSCSRDLNSTPYYYTTLCPRCASAQEAQDSRDKGEAVATDKGEAGETDDQA